MEVIYTPSHPLVATVSATYGLRADLLSAQIMAESSGDQFAFRYERDFFERYIEHKPSAMGFRYGPLAACSYGLLQVLLETALEFGFDGQPQALFEPLVGLSFGAKYLKHWLQLAGGDYRVALAKYNGSGGRAAAYATRVFALCDQQTKGVIT